MVPPRLKGGVSKYWLRARSGNRNGGKIIVSVDSLYNIFKDNDAVRTRRSDLTRVSSNARATTTQAALRQSVRLVNKRATLLRPQYWLRTRTKGSKRSVLVAVKSLYTYPDDTTEGKSNASCSIRRKSARLFEKRAASLLSCRTGRPAAFGQRRTARFKRKRKLICWLYKGTPCMGGSKVHPGIVDRSRGSKSACRSESKEVGIWCAPILFRLMLGASLRRLRLFGTGLLARCLWNWPELRMSLAYLFPSLINLNQWPTLLDGGADVNTSSSNKFRATQRSVLLSLTELGEEDLLQSILETLPPATLLQAARVCRSWARLCEPAFKDECHRKGWSLPRLPRGANPAFPWRSLYYRHACRACGKVGEFYVRKTLNGNFQFLLCGGCIRLPDVRDRLVQYSIDLYGVTGKLLVPSINTTRHAS